jgi:hypothetical protein
MIVVDLLLATICFGAMGEIPKCHPVLIGRETPVGTYNLTLRLTDQPGYGGDVIQFNESNDYVYAIHRVWTLNPKQNRLNRIKGPAPGRKITGGCINVMPKVYEELKTCCINQPLFVK